jgi:predicted secreted protein
MRRTPGAFRLCALLLLFTATPSIAQDAPKDIVLTDKDNGKSITLSARQRLVIKLPSTAGTGYGWSALMTPDSVLAFTDSPTDAKPATTASPMVGRPTPTVLSFRPVRYTESYSTSFTLIYCRAPCSPKDTGTKTFQIGVTTKG